MKTFFSFLILFLFLFIQGKSSTDSSKVSMAIANYLQENGFSGTILVAKNGQPIYHKSYGLAYRSSPDSIQNHYHYSIASITKLFTSIRVLQLVEEEKIELDEPIITYLPEYASLISPQVSIHHLLLHISGLPEEKDRDYWKHLSPRQMVERSLKKHKAGKFGSFNYNNIDYMLLGLIIESVSGNSWEDEIRQSILHPLQMKHTGFLAYGEYPDNFAYTYSQKRSSLRQDPLFAIENFYAAANMYANSEDLLKLDQALYTDQLLNAKSRQLLSQSYPQYTYTGYGVWNYNYPFVDSQPLIMERRGGIMGANAALLRLTDEAYTIIILSNDDRFNPDSFGDENNLREKLIRALYP